MKREAHLFLIKVPASPSPGESGELQRQEENLGDRKRGAALMESLILWLGGNLSPPGLEWGRGVRGDLGSSGACIGQLPTVSCPWGVEPPASSMGFMVEFFQRQSC